MSLAGELFAIINGQPLNASELASSPAPAGSLLTADGEGGADWRPSTAAEGVPTGGAQGQALVKKTSSDYDTEWGEAGVQIHGATDIGTDLADADEFPVYDASATANRKSAISRLWTYIAAKLASYAGDLTAKSLSLNQNISQAAWTTGGVRVKNSAVTLTDTTSSGTVAAAYSNRWGGNTIAASNATTFTEYATHYFDAPVAGANVNITNAYAVIVNGNAKTSGTLKATSASYTGMPLATFTPLVNNPPASAFATLDTRNSIATLDFDADTAESAVFHGIIPSGAVLTSGIKVRIFWAATTATSGATVWGASFEKYGTDYDADSFDTETTAYTTCSGTSGIAVVTEITCTAIDSLAAGDLFRLKIRRVATDATNDTMTGDAELIAVELQQVA